MYIFNDTLIQVFSICHVYLCICVIYIHIYNICLHDMLLYILLLSWQINSFGFLGWNKTILYIFYFQKNWQLYYLIEQSLALIM